MVPSTSHNERVLYGGQLHVDALRRLTSPSGSGGGFCQGRENHEMVLCDRMGYPRAHRHDT